MELGTDIDDEEDYEVPIAGGVSTPRKDKSDARKQLMKRQESWAVLQLDLGDLETKSPSARNSRGRKKVRSYVIPDVSISILCSIKNPLFFSPPSRLLKDEYIFFLQQ